MTQDVFDPARHAIVAVDPETKDHFHVSFPELRADLGLVAQTPPSDVVIPPAIDIDEIRSMVLGLLPIVPEQAPDFTEAIAGLNARLDMVAGALADIQSRIGDIENVVNAHTENFLVIKSKGGM